ncbi:hypothetical protein B0I37DRAFT_342463 [Chaetomium sp. MPI-CAGE-AT-0009]|nr:hypothetical protein B0I37DRAFT_342463 [Chaetomium sp. MPI-CAGE-AT-0009]
MILLGWVAGYGRTRSTWNTRGYGGAHNRFVWCTAIALITGPSRALRDHVRIRTRGTEKQRRRGYTTAPTIEPPTTTAATTAKPTPITFQLPLRQSLLSRQTNLSPPLPPSSPHPPHPTNRQPAADSAANSRQCSSAHSKQRQAGGGASQRRQPGQHARHADRVGPGNGHHGHQGGGGGGGVGCLYLASSRACQLAGRALF